MNKSTLTLLTALLLAPLAAQHAADAAAPSAKPNILWIVTTQWRAQACGYAGDPNASTPTMDALAAESVNVPLPTLVRPPAPVSAPDRVASTTAPPLTTSTARWAAS